MVQNIVNSFVTFILEDPNYYNLSKKEVAANMGTIGMISETINVFFQLVAGVLIDTFGRKVPLIIGFMVAGAAMGCIPLFTSLYPGYLMLRTLIGLGITVGQNIPLIPDYVHKDFVGIANGYQDVFKTAAGIIA